MIYWYRPFLIWIFCTPHAPRLAYNVDFFLSYSIFIFGFTDLVPFDLSKLNVSDRSVSTVHGAVNVRANPGDVTGMLKKHRG